MDCARIGSSAVLPERSALAEGTNHNPNYRAKAAQWHSKALPALMTPKKKGQDVARRYIHDPETMKLLVIGVDGTEPSYAAIQAFLDQIGIPYDTFLSLNHLNNPSQYPLPVLSPGPGVANYYGIVLTSGNLTYCVPNTSACQLTFSAADWAALDSFTAAFGVRTVSYYTFPEARYGLSFVSAISPTPASPASVTIPAAGLSTFSYLQPNASIPVQNAYTYLAAPVAAAGETTTPILQTIQGGINYTVGAIHTAATGQQYLALTMDNNPYLVHSLALNYGVFNWVTKGLFLGARKVYLSPQVDDVFIGDDLFDPTKSACIPSGFLVDPTVDLSAGCPVFRMTGNELQTLYSWQTGLNLTPQTAKFKVTLAFNGLGTTRAGGSPVNDTLISKAQLLGKSFNWISHTYNHPNLDCYEPVANSGICTPATQAQSNAEISQNVTVASRLNFSTAFDAKSMVTPEVSGLANRAFIAAAYGRGIRYLVSDASKDGQKAPSANTGIPNAINPNILEVPRFATNIFYNTDTATLDIAGAEVNEYNHFFGPLGISKDGNGNPFFAADQTYAQIIDTESNNLLMNMLRYYAFPSMFHQTNLHVYSGTKSMFTDTIGATITKFKSLSNLPIISQNEASIGALLLARMNQNASGMTASWTPSGPTGTGIATGSITITVTKAAVIDMTGIVCPLTGASCETYGGQTIAHINVTPAAPVTVVSSF